MEFLLHYIDDFLLLGPPDSAGCAAAAETTLCVFNQLGLPVADTKIEGPSTCLYFLGIEIVTQAL